MTHKGFIHVAAVLAALSITAAATAAHAAGATSDATASASASGVVNLNTASEEQLLVLPGVGPAKAAAVVAWRTKYGSFKKVDDLSKVKGFSYKTLKRLRPYLSVSGSTTLKETPHLSAADSE